MKRYAQTRASSESSVCSGNNCFCQRPIGGWFLYFKNSLLGLELRPLPALVRLLSDTRSRSGHRETPTTNCHRLGCGQALLAHKRRPVNAECDFACYVRIDEAPRLAACKRPSPPHYAKRTPIGRGVDLIRAVRRNDDSPVIQLQIRHERRIDLLDRRREARESVGSWQVIRNAGLSAGGYRQCKADWSLANKPHAGF